MYIRLACLGFLFILGCKETSVCYLNNLNYLPNEYSITENEITKRNIGDTILFERLLDRRNVFGDLDTLEKGFKGLEIRIWVEYSEVEKEQIIIFKFDSTFTAQLATYSVTKNDDGDSIISIEKNIKVLAVRRDWRAFIDTLDSYGIFTIPDESEVKDIARAYNATTLLVEIAECDRYRFYSYTSPVRNASKVLQAKMIENILNTISRECGITYLDEI